MGIKVKSYKTDLSANTVVTSTGQVKQGKYLEHDLKSVFQTRLDIKNWKQAEQLYYSGQNPKSYKLQLILSDIMKDALLSSQMQNRLQALMGLDIQLKKANGDVDKVQSAAYKKTPIHRFLTQASAESLYYENSVVELSMAQTIEGVNFLVAELIQRTNIVPVTGLFYPDYMSDNNATAFRNMPEYGVWILEFWNKSMPLLNKAVPHVLFKRFAQSCWSELCEIYGIPPRVLKTNTQDPGMMSRATKMMKDMGAASWFIIDDQESFDFAKGADTNGDVYNNLINLCSNEISLLVVGAILGQDTKNGSRSKDDVAKEILMQLVQADCAMVEEHYNTVILPALKRHGVISKDIVSIEFSPFVNVNELFERVKALISEYDFDIDWLNETFGLKVSAKKTTLTTTDKKNLLLQLFGESDFFGSARRRNAA